MPSGTDFEKAREVADGPVDAGAPFAGVPFLLKDIGATQAGLPHWLGNRALKAMDLPGPVTIVGIVFLVGAVNLLVGSASAKWGLISPVVVPMLMQLGISPDLTQAAYRVGDSCTNIITPLMPYFPLVVVFCQRYVKKTGIGTVVSIMLPYSLVLVIVWSLLLVLFWVTGIPLGTQSSYVYP